METTGKRKEHQRRKEFKSYYVVWKLYIYKIYIITDKGLNRTM